MLALDIHFIQGYFGNPVSSTSCPGLVCFALLLFCFVLFFDIWLIPAELGRFPVGPGAGALLRHGLLPSSTASVSLFCLLQTQDDFN